VTGGIRPCPPPQTRQLVYSKEYFEGRSTSGRLVEGEQVDEPQVRHGGRPQRLQGKEGGMGGMGGREEGDGTVDESEHGKAAKLFIAPFSQGRGTGTSEGETRDGNQRNGHRCRMCGAKPSPWPAKRIDRL